MRITRWSVSPASLDFRGFASTSLNVRDSRELDGVRLVRRSVGIVVSQVRPGESRPGGGAGSLALRAGGRAWFIRRAYRSCMSRNEREERGEVPVGDSGPAAGGSSGTEGRRRGGSGRRGRGDGGPRAEEISVAGSGLELLGGQSRCCIK